MKISDSNVIRLAVLQHLRVVYGIKLKTSFKIKDDSSTPCSRESSTKVFGVSLENVYACAVAEYGLVPSFLVDACQHLSKYADTEGLFRKSSSVVRLKSLKAKLDQGENCLTTALPCDVASLVKQFFRELPDPIFPAELHQALLQAQQQPTEQARAVATQLLSCLLPERNSTTLRFLSSFLKRISQRATENKMTAHNLSVIFAPNLFASDTGLKGVEGHDEFHVAVTYSFIENAHLIGVIPEVVVETIPSLVDACLLEEIDMDLRRKRRGRHSDAVLPTRVQGTPSSNGKLSSQPSKEGIHCRNRRPRERRSFCLGMLPRVLFNSTDSCPLVTDDARSRGPTKANRCMSVYQKVRRAVKENISCLSSSKQEEHHPPTPTALQSVIKSSETPVGIPKEKPKPDAVPRKSSSLSSLLKTLCCASSPDHLDEPEPSPSKICGFTQDGGRLLMDSENNNTPQVNPNVRERDPACSALTLPVCATPVGSVFPERTPLSHVDMGASPFIAFTVGPTCQGSELNEPEYTETHKETTQGGKVLEALNQSNNVLEEDNQHTDMLYNTTLNPPCGSASNQDQNGGHLLKPGTGATEPLLGTPTASKPHAGRVAARIKAFSSLHLRCLTPKVVRSPIHFQRTPVYHYVKRMNSLIERGCKDRGSYKGGKW